jgi:D-arabinose 1-dehydrogenase-like Zn-dependent alcohol dehydrogenase
MNAIYFTQFKGPLEIKDIPVPTATNDGVVIKVEATGLCRSDWHAWMGHDSDIVLPHVPGHEFAGVISEIGKAVTKFKVAIASPFHLFADAANANTACVVMLKSVPPKLNQALPASVLSQNT